MSRSTSGRGPARRDAYHHGDLRNALIEAGTAVLGEAGVDGLSLREVARRARVSQAAPYHHFAGKAELVGAIVSRGFQDFTAALHAGADAAGGGALQRLTGMGLAYVRFAVGNAQVFRLMFRPELRGEAGAGAAREAIAAAGDAAYQVFLDAVAAAVAEGSVRGPVEDAAIAAWSVVHGLSTLLVDGPANLGGRAPDELAQVVILALGAGIAGDRMP
jgi:AcrR family transcriptional regulator